MLFTSSADDSDCFLAGELALDEGWLFSHSLHFPFDCNETSDEIMIEGTVKK